VTRQVSPLTPHHHHQIGIILQVPLQLTQMQVASITLMAGVQDYQLTQHLSSTNGPLETLSNTLLGSNSSQLQLV